MRPSWGDSDEVNLNNVDLPASAATIPVLELDRDSTRPLHQQLWEHYRQLIEVGHLPVGSRLPTELILVQRHRVSRGTVRQAMRSLSEAGLIRRETKNGTVVSTPPQKVATTSRIIGLVFPETRDAFCLDIMKGVQAACLERGYHVAFGYSHHSSEVERAEIKRMRDARFGGVLVLPHDNATLFRELWRDGYPFVCVDQIFKNVPCDFVGVDNVSASSGATEHLLRLGHRRIAFLHQNAELAQAPSTVRDRHRGYCSALAASGVPFAPSWTVAVDQDSSYMDFLIQPERPCAVVAVNDNTALKLRDIAIRSGISVPGDLAIVGFDNIPMASGVSLTTVMQPSIEIGLQAAHILIDRIEKKVSSPQQLILPTQLVVRQSCGSA